MLTLILLTVFGSMLALGTLTIGAMLFWFLLLALGRAWYIAVPGRARYAAIGEKMARRVFRIRVPAASDVQIQQSHVPVVGSDQAVGSGGAD